MIATQRNAYPNREKMTYTPGPKCSTTEAQIFIAYMTIHFPVEERNTWSGTLGLNDNKRPLRKTI